MRTLSSHGLERLFEALDRRGFTVVGPTVRDGSIVYDELSSADDLPAGWTDRQEPGSFRLERREDRARFAFTPGADSWKRFLFPPRTHLFRSRRDPAGGFEIENESLEAPRYAFVGVRACELQAIAVQDRVFLGSRFMDPTYRARREGLFTVAIQCGHSGATCFCASLGTGPAVDGGADLVLTELAEPPEGNREEPTYLATSGTEDGAQVLAELDAPRAGEPQRAAADAAVERARRDQVRAVDPEGLPQLLARSAESPHWDDVARRCMSCGNCTLVCPTCFCSTVEDTTDLSGKVADRWRRWDVCFHTEFSYLHGGSIRASVKARYRHWLTHKLGTWVEQFGTFGCVGCGRCITWCPVGIDLTEEVRSLRRLDAGEPVQPATDRPALDSTHATDTTGADHPRTTP